MEPIGATFCMMAAMDDQYMQSRLALLFGDSEFVIFRSWYEGTV